MLTENKFWLFANRLKCTLKPARIANVDEVGKFKDIPAMQTSLL